MGFFKDFKDDFSQAVNELMPGDDRLDSGSEDDMVVNTLEGEVDVESELSKLDGLLEQVSKPDAPKAASARAAAPAPQQAAQPRQAAPSPAPQPQAQPQPSLINISRTTQEENNMDASTPINPMAQAAPSQSPAPQPISPSQGPDLQERVATDEISIITEGTVIHGDVVSSGSLDVRGQVDGNVSCNGKLTVTGIVNGNSNTSEFFADSAQVEGEVVSSGTVKIGLGSVIIGNVTSSSAVIAGAIKGDIDVQGPVVVDTSAVVMGNIKSRSVQINNGAVIEGFCSQCYSDVDVNNLFDSKKANA